MRLTTLALANTSTNTILFPSLPGYDAAGNVTAVSTTLANGTDNQQFCYDYDAQNRLTWAGAMGTVPCTNQVITSGSAILASRFPCRPSQAFQYLLSLLMEMEGADPGVSGLMERRSEASKRSSSRA